MLIWQFNDPQTLADNNRKLTAVVKEKNAIIADLQVCVLCVGLLLLEIES